MENYFGSMGSKERSQGHREGSKRGSGRRPRQHAHAWIMPPLAVRRGMHAHGVFHHLLCGVPSACVEETHMSDCLVRKVGQLELCHRKPQTAFTCTILLLKAALKWKHIRNAHFLHLQTFIQHSKNSVIRPNLFFP